MLGKSISQNSLILGAFAAITAGLIAATFQGTQTRIEDAERRAAQKALFQIVPQTKHNNDLLNETITLTTEQSAELGYKQEAQIHVAKLNGELVAIIMPVIAADGYSGDIKLIVGINRDGSVAGARVLSHKETPGLGDKADINKSPWILGFDGKSLSNPAEAKWKVKKDGGEFDQFTGATITPRAVVRAIKSALVFYQTHQTEITEQAKSTETH